MFLQTVFGAPTTENDDSTVSEVDEKIKQFEKSLKCVDGVLVDLVKEHKELEKHHSQFKTYWKETNSKLADCKKIEKTELRDE